MNNSCQFVVAVHILAVLRTREEVAHRFGQEARATSDEIAESVNTNPVVIRRILSQLQEVGLVHTKAGRGGGTTLARSTEQISLYDVYEAVKDGALFRMHHTPPNMACPVGGNIQHVMRKVFEKAYRAMQNVLEGITVEEIFTAVIDRSGIPDMLRAGLSFEEIEAELERRAPALVGASS